VEGEGEVGIAEILVLCFVCLFLGAGGKGGVKLCFSHWFRFAASGVYCSRSPGCGVWDLFDSSLLMKELRDIIHDCGKLKEGL